MKPCPFCAESIQDAAIKCRFCGSMLDGSGGAPTGNALVQASGGHAASTALAAPRVVYEGTPSWKAWFWSYVAAGILSLVVVGLIWMAVLHWKRKSIHYKITDRTIDYEAGLLSRRVETLQLWRVQDLDMQQTFMERLLGVAQIRVFTKDTTDPELVLRGLPASRDIFEALKGAAELSRQQRVVGLVE